VREALFVPPLQLDRLGPGVGDLSGNAVDGVKAFTQIFLRVYFSLLPWISRITSLDTFLPRGHGVFAA
jgi:hypothetical protein